MGLCLWQSIQTWRRGTYRLTPTRSCRAASTRKKLDILRRAYAIYLDEIRKAGLYDKIWQAFAVLLPVQTVQRMYKEYYSKKYDWAPMPYSIFFRGGYAIHGTGEVKRLGRVASHGCVRLSTENARRLYRLVQQHGSGNVSIRVKG